MKSYILPTLVFAFLIAEVWGQEQKGLCDPRNLERCTHQLEKLINSRALAIVSTKDQLIKECPPLQDAMQCVDDFNFQCVRKEILTKMNRYYAGMRDYLQDVCNEGDVQNEFLEHAPCMANLRSESDQCSDRYSNRSAAAVRPNQQAADTLQFDPSLCCPFNEMSVCLRKMYKENCGAEAAAIADKLLMKMAGPIVRESCLNDDNEFQCSSSSKMDFWAPVVASLAAVAAVVGLRRP